MILHIFWKEILKNYKINISAIEKVASLISSDLYIFRSFADTKQPNTLQVPHVTWLSRSGHLCSSHFDADGVVVTVRGTTVVVVVVVVML